MPVVDTPYFVSKLNNMKKILTILYLIGISLTAKTQIKDTLTRDSLKKILLQQVVVTNQTPPIAIKLDKVVLNVEAMVNAAGLNALELLRQAPGVTVDGQDNVKMSGKSGIQILLDGRLQTLSNQQIISLLKGTNSATIKSIEIIANPSAKYDAAGNAGIINIIFKKSDRKGTSGNITAGYQQMQNYRQNSAFNLNIKQGKFSMYTNANFDNSLQNTKVQSTRLLTIKSFEQTGIEKQGYSNPGIRTGITYELNEHHKMGVLFNYQRIWDDFPSTVNTIVNNTENPDLLTTSTLANLTENRFAYNLNYQFISKNKTTLTIDADQLTYNSILGNQVNNSFKNSAIRTNFANDTKTKISLAGIKADVTSTIGRINIETGVKFSSSQTNNVLNAYQYNTTGQSIFQFNDFDYHENNYAVYASLNRTFGNWSLQAGLRAELTQMKGISINELQQLANLPDTTYLNLFPTTFISYQFNEKQSLGFSFSRRINRPSFQDQNPYHYRTDFYYSNQGNPLLLPQFTQTFEISYTFNRQTQIKLNFNQTRDLIEVISTQKGDQTLTLPVNAGKRSFVNVSISSPAQLTKFWSIYYTAEPYYQFYRADLSGYSGLTKINNGGFGFNSYLSNNFTFSKTLKGSLSSWFNYASRSSIYATKPIYSIDVALKKQLLANKLNMTLAFRDILNTQRWEQTMVLGDVNQTSIRKWESRGAYVAMSYNFGNGKIKSTSEKEKTEEQQRIKQRN